VIPACNKPELIGIFKLAFRGLKIMESECGYWERGCTVSFLGIHKSDLVCSERTITYQVHFLLERVQCRFNATLTPISRTEENLMYVCEGATICEIALRKDFKVVQNFEKSLFLK
jgi:hypothetical protein